MRSARDLRRVRASPTPCCRSPGALKRRRLQLGVFYETKANLTKDQLRALREAGIGTIQPGIESLSTDVLRTMRKGTTAVQKGPLWWAAHHRKHHLYADTDRDIHSPQRGFWWSHIGWILCDKYKTVDYKDIRDLAKYPELRFLDRQHWLGPAGLLIVCALVGGYRGVLFGFFLCLLSALM